MAKRTRRLNGTRGHELHTGPFRTGPPIPYVSEGEAPELPIGVVAPALTKLQEHLKFSGTERERAMVARFWGIRR